MFDSQLYRRLSLAAAVLGFLIAAACSNQPGRQSVHAAGGAASGAATVNSAGDVADSTQALHLVTLPRGTEITATVGQTLASNKNHWGDTFEATIARPVKVDGKIVLPRGTEVTGRVRAINDHELKVVLSSVVVHGIYCDLATNSRRPSDKVQPKRQSAKNRKHKKDNTTLSAKTRLTFKLSKDVTIPAKA
jgi:hypothetical protein